MTGRPQRIAHLGLVLALATAVGVPGLLAGCATDRERDLLDVRLAWSRPEPGTTEATTRDDRRVWIAGAPVFDASDVRSARVTLDALGRPAVLVELTDAGADALRRATVDHVGEPLAMLVRGELVNAPVVQSPISRRAMITGLDEAEADALVRALGGPGRE